MKGDIWFYYKTPLEGDIVSVSGTHCSMKGIECLDRMQGLFVQVGILQMRGIRKLPKQGRGFLKR